MDIDNIINDIVINKLYTNVIRYEINSKNTEILLTLKYFIIYINNVSYNHMSSTDELSASKIVDLMKQSLTNTILKLKEAEIKIPVKFYNDKYTTNYLGSGITKITRLYQSIKTSEILDLLYGNNIELKESEKNTYTLLSKNQNMDMSSDMFKQEILKYIKDNYIQNSINEFPSNVKTVTLKEFERKLDDPDYINKIRKTLTQFFGWKLDQYSKRIIDFETEIARDSRIYKASGLTEDASDTSNKNIKLAKGSLFVSQEDAINFIKHLSQMSVQDLQYRYKQIIHDPRYGLNNLIGSQYDIIKMKIATILNSLSRGMEIFTKTFQNIVITGPAGVGKTTLATYLAHAYHNAGILATNIVKVVSRSDLVAAYIGQTSIKTKLKLLSSLESVILIDEAYQLGGCPNEDSYGMESIGELVNFLDKYIGLNIVIVAGYKSQMSSCFFKRNEGLPRRFPNIYELKPYQPIDLMTMFISNIYQSLHEYYKTIDTLIPYLQIGYQIFQKLSDDNYFPNQGGDIGFLTSNYYYYYYSDNNPVTSLIYASFDLGITKQLDSTILNNNIKLFLELK